MQSAAVKSYNQPMAEDILYPRFAERRLTEALEDSPVVLIQGPRQCGKTTLAQMVCTSENRAGGKHPSSPLSGRPGDYTYFSFDDEVVRAGAEADPLGFVAELPDRVILDEVQRVPTLFAALKLEVDRRRLDHGVQTAITLRAHMGVRRGHQLSGSTRFRRRSWPPAAYTHAHFAS